MHFDINVIVSAIKMSIKPPDDMDNVTLSGRLKYNFMIVREFVKTYLPNRKLENLRNQIQEYLPGDETNPIGEFIVAEELESPQDIILMDERGRLRKVDGLGGSNQVDKEYTQNLPSISIDSSTLIYFGGIGSRAIYPNIIETDSHIKNRIGSTANTLEKIILHAYEMMGFVDNDAPKKDKLRSLGVTATYVYAYHSHGLVLDPFSDEDIRLKNLIWDYELLRLRHNPEGYYGKEEQLFVENMILPKIAKVIEIHDGKFVRDAETGRIRVSGAYDMEILLHNCRLTMMGYSLGSDVIHRIRNCMIAYLRDLYPESIVRRALQQVVAVTSCGANPFLGDSPNFTLIRCVDIHDLGTIIRNPKLYMFPWMDMETGTSRIVQISPNEIMCWMRTPYQSDERINIGYHDEKFCMNPNYFPAIARDAIIMSATYKGILPKNALKYITASPVMFRQSFTETSHTFLAASPLITTKRIIVAIIIVIMTFIAFALNMGSLIFSY